MPYMGVQFDDPGPCKGARCAAPPGIAHTCTFGEGTGSEACKVLLSFFTYFILFNNLVPISLYVSLEFVKVGSALPHLL